MLYDLLCYENCFHIFLYLFVLLCGSIIGDSRFAAINPTRKIPSRGSNSLLISEMQPDGSLGLSFCLINLLLAFSNNNL